MSGCFPDLWKRISRKKTGMSSSARFSSQHCVLSIVDITCLGLATTLGTGVYMLISTAAHDHAGPSIVLSILIAAVTACLGGLCYSEVVTRFPRGGSAYTYVYATIGEYCGFLVGWGMVLEYILGTALAAKACSQYLDVVANGSLSRILGQSLGRLYVSGLDEYLDVPAVIVIAAVGVMLTWAVKALCVLNNVMVVVNLLVISGIVLVGVFNIDSENWIAGKGFFPNGVTGIFSAASLCYFAFVGYDVTAISTSYTSHRSKVYPTTIGLVFVVGLLATFSISAVITLFVPYSLLESRGSILEAFEIRGVVGMKYLAAVGAVSGLISATTASFFSLARLLQSLSNDGLLFKFLHRSSCSSILTSGVLCSALSLFCSVNSLIHALGMGTLASCIAIGITVLCLRYGFAGNLTTDLMELSEEDLAQIDQHSDDELENSKKYIQRRSKLRLQKDSADHGSISGSESKPDGNSSHSRYSKIKYDLQNNYYCEVDNGQRNHVDSFAELYKLNCHHSDKEDDARNQNDARFCLEGTKTQSIQNIDEMNRSEDFNEKQSIPNGGCTERNSNHIEKKGSISSSNPVSHHHHNDIKYESIHPDENSVAKNSPSQSKLLNNDSIGGRHHSKPYRNQRTGMDSMDDEPRCLQRSSTDSVSDRHQLIHHRNPKTSLDKVPRSSRPDYGSMHSRSLSVDLVNEGSYVTCLSELSPHWSRREPNHRSAATAAGLIAAAMLIMLLMGVMAFHVPKFSTGRWSEVAACALFAAAVVCAALICRQPRHSSRLGNKVPCVPFLPLCAMWMDVHLVVSLPYSSWMVFLVWTIVGTLLYLSYGIWNSTECNSEAAQSVNLLNVGESFESMDKHPLTTQDIASD